MLTGFRILSCTFCNANWCVLASYAFRVLWLCWWTCSISSRSGGRREEDRILAAAVTVFTTKHVVRILRFTLNPNFLFFLPAMAANGQPPPPHLFASQPPRKAKRREQTETTLFASACSLPWRPAIGERLQNIEGLSTKRSQRKSPPMLIRNRMR